uniref:(California timema) hypothetical protein n=1 Tax=Timema californicum TaxID=61474 RepID=A0A7R9JFR2_TIMCA|nr:unnamed protein product [Timema californicum]
MNNTLQELCQVWRWGQPSYQYRIRDSPNKIPLYECWIVIPNLPSSQKKFYIPVQTSSVEDAIAKAANHINFINGKVCQFTIANMDAEQADVSVPVKIVDVMGQPEHVELRLIEIETHDAKTDHVQPLSVANMDAEQVDVSVPVMIVDVMEQPEHVELRLIEIETHDAKTDHVQPRCKYWCILTTEKRVQELTSELSIHLNGNENDLLGSRVPLVVEVFPHGAVPGILIQEESSIPDITPRTFGGKKQPPLAARDLALLRIQEQGFWGRRNIVMACKDHEANTEEGPVATWYYVACKLQCTAKSRGLVTVESNG